jgi:hypothetical protein
VDIGLAGFGEGVRERQFVWKGTRTKRGLESRGCFKGVSLRYLEFMRYFNLRCSVRRPAEFGAIFEAARATKLS